MLNHSQQGLLNIAGQIIEAADSHGRSVKSDSPEAVVLAREQHLEKAIKIRLFICCEKLAKLKAIKVLTLGRKEHHRYLSRRI